MIKFYQTSCGSDCTGPYAIEFSMPMTVRKFINELLTNYPDEWGYIGIKHKDAIFGNPYCEYNRGKLLSSLPEEYLDKEILNIAGSGGWTRSDFIIETEPIKALEEKKIIKGVPDQEKLVQYYGNMVAVQTLKLSKALLDDYRNKFYTDNIDIDIAIQIINKQIEDIKKGGILEDNSN